jgi:hypothetical protein
MAIYSWRSESAIASGEALRAWLVEGALSPGNCGYRIGKR